MEQVRIVLGVGIDQYENLSGFSTCATTSLSGIGGSMAYGLAGESASPLIATSGGSGMRGVISFYTDEEIDSESLDDHWELTKKP